MTAAIATSRPIAASSQQPAGPQPRQSDERSLRRFKALVEREPDAPEPHSASPETRPSAKQRTDHQEPGASDLGEKAKLPAAPPSQPGSRSSDAGDRIAALQRASELSLGLDRAHARPTTTQLLLTAGETAIAGGTISQADAPGTMDIVILPGSQLLTSDTLEALRRRLAARGLAIGQLRLAQPDEELDAAHGTGR